jgi:hypothetical protein
MSIVYANLQSNGFLFAKSGNTSQVGRGNAQFNSDCHLVGRDATQNAGDSIKRLGKAEKREV